MTSLVSDAAGNVFDLNGANGVVAEHYLNTGWNWFQVSGGGMTSLVSDSTGNVFAFYSVDDSEREHVLGTGWNWNLLAPNSSAQTSSNWSGYVAATNFNHQTQNSVTYVGASWVVPSVTGPANTATHLSVWVGIDGYNGNTVEQVGTEEDVINGQAYYSAWWEMYSTQTQQPEQPITGMTIQPGDTINAFVQFITTGAHSGQYLLSITDVSRQNDSFSTYQTSAATQNPTAQNNCAEWIVEAPSYGGSIASIPNFGNVTFNKATTVINGIQGSITSPNWQSIALNLRSSTGAILDTTSVTAINGGTFMVSYNIGGSTVFGTDIGNNQPTNDTVVVIHPRKIRPGVDSQPDLSLEPTSLDAIAMSIVLDGGLPRRGGTPTI